METLFEEVEEQRSWELYCHSINARMMTGDDRSFDEWRKNSKKEEQKSMTNDEILAAQKKSDEILKRISPRKKEGR